MTLTNVGTNVIIGDRGDSVTTLPMTDSTTLTAGDFLELSSGKLIKSITTLSGDLVGIAATTKTSLVAATSKQDYMGVVAEGLVKVKGLVEGSGGTYKTAIAVGTKVSFHYDATSGYGQFVVNSTSSPVGTVVQGTVASSGGTDDYYDYVLVQLDFEGMGSNDIADGSVSTAKVADSAVTSTKTGTDVPGSINATKQHLDVGTFTLNATLGTETVDWSETLTASTGVKVFLQTITATNTALSAGTMTATNFVITGVGSQTGVWFAWIPESSK